MADDLIRPPESAGTVARPSVVQRRMHADTDAIRSYGRITADLGTDLHDAAKALTTVAAPMVTAAFGAVGARFAAALGEATADLANSVSRIGDAMASSGDATVAAARGYDDVEQRSRGAITVLGA